MYHQVSKVETHAMIKSTNSCASLGAHHHHHDAWAETFR